MFRRISIPLGLIAIATAPGAFAGSDSPWSASFAIGTQLIPHGKFQADHAATVANLGTIDPKLAGNSGVVVIRSPQFDDIFRAGPGGSLELGYDLSKQFSTFARLSYAQLDGRTTRLGDVHVSGQPLPTEIRGEFDDVHSWALGLGARYFVTDSSAWRPFFAGYIGADRADEVRVHIRVEGTPVGGVERMLPRETRLNAGVQFGVSYDFSEQTSVRFSIGGDYRAPRHEESSAYQAFGVSSVRISAEGWTVPVELGMSWKF